MRCMISKDDCLNMDVSPKLLRIIFWDQMQERALGGCHGFLKPKDRKQNGRSILISENNACVQLYCWVYQPDKTDFFFKFNFPHPLFILWLTVTFLHYMAKMLQDLQINNSSFSYLVTIVKVKRIRNFLFTSLVKRNNFK